MSNKQLSTFKHHKKAGKIEKTLLEKFCIQEQNNDEEPKYKLELGNNFSSNG